MENNSKSSLPIVIIGGVLLIALVGGWWFYNSSTTAPARTATNTAANNSGKNWNDIFAKAPPGATPAWSKGAPNAPVVVEEFADFQCPTCASMHPKVQELQAAYGNRIKIIFRQFPLQMHQWSYDAACATEAAGMQGKFWDMQNLIFTNQQTWSASSDARKIFTEYAKTLGLDEQKFSDDMIGMVAKNRVDADLQRGRAVSVASTPSFYINNQPLGNNLNALRQTVDAELQKTQAR
jgi:thiol-disulfide isomerase/thioredoxin